MTIDQDTTNRRIQVIGDNVNIHENFRKILSLPIEPGALDYARAALFGETLTIPTHVRYEWTGRGSETEARDYAWK